MRKTGGRSGVNSIPPLTPGIDYGGPLVPGKRFGPDPEIQEEEIKRMFQPRGYKRGGHRLEWKSNGC